MDPERTARAWRRTGWGLFASLLAASGSTAGPRPPSLTLIWADAHGLVMAGAARGEIEDLLAAAGVEVGWTNEPREAARTPRHETILVIVPSDPAGAGWDLDRSALGVYLNSEGSGAVYVFHRRIADVLGLSPESGLLTPSERRLVARAVARVAVHELVHRVAPSLPHAREGLFQSRLERSLLTRKRPTLDETSRAALRAALPGASRDRLALVERPR